MRAAVVLLLIAGAWACGEAETEPDAGPARDGAVADSAAPVDAAPLADAAPGDAGEGIVDAGDAPPDASEPSTGCSASGLELVRLVNAYRAEHGLPAIPASPSLCTVASAHTRDLADNAPHTAPGCNLHSWSSAGSWSSCCYTSDHAAARCMWDKPRELTSYPGNGYENSYRGSNDPVAVLDGWKRSSGHNDVILNRGGWSQPWGALGADIHDGFGVLWFGREPDPAAR